MVEEIRKTKFVLGQNIYRAKHSRIWVEPGIWPFCVAGILETPNEVLYTRDRHPDGAEWVLETHLFLSPHEAEEDLLDGIKERSAE